MQQAAFIPSIQSVLYISVIIKNASLILAIIAVVAGSERKEGWAIIDSLDQPALALVRSDHYFGKSHALGPEIL